MLRSLHVRGYRSLRDIRVKFGRITVVTGENGVGKSNLYRALALLQRMAEGRFAEAVESEGGMPGLMWAGRQRKDGPALQPPADWVVQDHGTSRIVLVFPAAEGFEAKVAAGSALLARALAGTSAADRPVLVQPYLRYEEGAPDGDKLATAVVRMSVIIEP